MQKRLLIGLVLAVLLAVGIGLELQSDDAVEAAPSQQASNVELYRESFDGSTTAYTLSSIFYDSDSDHFGVTDGTTPAIDNVTGPYTNQDGTFYLAGEDLDDTGSVGADGEDFKTLVTNSIDVTGYDNLRVVVAVAAGNENGPGSNSYDLADVLTISYNMDSAGYGADQTCGDTTNIPGNRIGQFSYVAAGDDFNEPIALDTDFDCNGEGTVLGTAFTDFTFNIPVTGSSLELTLFFHFDAASEEIAVDNIRVLGDEVAGGVANVKINEFAAKGTEFVELYNAGTGDADLTGWYLDDADCGSGTSTIAATTLTPSNFFVVNAGDAGANFSLDNAGDVLVLCDNTDTEIDRVAYSITGGAPVGPTANTVARVSDGVDTDDFAADFNLAAASTAGATNDNVPAVNLGGGTILINELDPFANSGTEFVELYNPSGSDIDITGWALSDTDGLDTLSGTVPAMGFLQLVQNTDYTSSNFATGDVAYLFNASGERVDQLGYDGEFVDDCIARVPNGSGPNDGFNFASSNGGTDVFDQTCTPGATNVLTSPSVVVINEFLADPAGSAPDGDANGDGVRDSSDDEFIEIVNVSGGDLDLSGWTISDGANGVRHTVPANTIIADQCALVVFGGGTPTGTFGGATVQTASNSFLSLNNGGDTITINNGVSDVVVFTYGSDAQNDQSRTLDPDITGSTFVDHSTATGASGALFSPGTQIDGTNFSGCVVADTPPTVTSTTPANNATNVAANTNIDITFSEAVSFDTNSFTISGSVSGVVAAAIVGTSPTTSYTLNPDTDFSAGETVTVTLIAAQIADVDGSADQLGSDFVFSFTITTGAVTNFIHEIQGSGDSVAITTPVTVQAVVVGDFQEDDQLDGFFIQEEDTDADGDNATSEGIFVFCGNNCTASFPDVAEGDLVTVSGTPTEFFDMSQIDVTGGGSITIDSSGNSNLVTPTTITLPVPDGTAINDFYEPFEGMLITFSNTMLATEYFELGRYGQVVLVADERPFQYTQDPANRPFTAGAYTDFLDDLDRNTIILDDDNNIQNSQLDFGNPANDTPIFHPQPGGFSVNNFFRGGSTVGTSGGNLVGVLHWSWAGQGGTDAWRVRPQMTNAVTFDNSSNPRPPAPAIDADVTIASFNVLNFFNGDGAGGGFPTSRGATTQAEFIRQRDKIVTAIIELDADVVGLIEIENEADNPADGITSATEDLVIALNASAGADTWDYVVTTTAIGTDEIKQAIIYQAAIVSPVGAIQVVDDPEFVEPRSPGDPKSRPAVIQTFEIVEAGNAALGAEFTVIVNHLKSKGSGCGAGDDDTTTGQGSCNGTRTDAVDYLINTWLSNNGFTDADNIVVIGDINAYYAEDPMQVFYDANYTNVLRSDEYTYLFDGQIGSLDHILVNAALADNVVGAAPWNINADEVNVLDYNDDLETDDESNFERKPTVSDLYDPDAFRSSDHDPVIVGLNLSSIVSTAPTVIDNTPVANATDIAVDANITVTFDSDVIATEDAFTITCTESGTVSFTLSGGPVTFTLDPSADLVEGETCTVTVVAVNVTNTSDINLAEDFIFSFTIGTESTGGGNDGGNGSTPDVNVADPAVSKLGELQPGQLGLPGEQLTWVVTVVNNGAVAATNVVISDQLRSELRIDGATSERGTVSINGQTVTVTVASLGAGESFQIRIQTTVLSNPSAGTLDNTVTLTADGNIVRSATSILPVPTGLPDTGYPPREE